MHGRTRHGSCKGVEGAVEVEDEDVLQPIELAPEERVVGGGDRVANVVTLRVADRLSGAPRRAAQRGHRVHHHLGHTHTLQPFHALHDAVCHVLNVGVELQISMYVSLLVFINMSNYLMWRTVNFIVRKTGP